MIISFLDSWLFVELSTQVVNLGVLLDYVKKASPACGSHTDVGDPDAIRRENSNLFGKKRLTKNQGNNNQLFDTFSSFYNLCSVGRVY